jgi:hypothetical protein
MVQIHSPRPLYLSLSYRITLQVPLSLAKTLGVVLSFTPLTMLQAFAQAVDSKVGHQFGEGQVVLFGMLSLVAQFVYWSPIVSGLNQKHA